MMREWLFDFKHEHPFSYRLAVSIITLVICVSGFMLIPKSDFAKFLGVEKVQGRGTALRHALYWESRAIFNKPATIEHSILYGFLHSVDRHGVIVVSVPLESEYVKREFTLADMKVKDFKAIDSFIKSNKTASVRLEVYGDMVVVYLGAIAMNVGFIESGFAIPDLNPPSKIVDIAFATYYWSLVRGKEFPGEFYIAR